MCIPLAEPRWLQKLGAQRHSLASLEEAVPAGTTQTLTTILLNPETLNQFPLDIFFWVN